MLRDLESKVSNTGDRYPISVLAPFTEEPIGSVPECVADDLPPVFDRAREAQSSWSARPVGDRARIFERFHDLLIDRADVAMDLIQLEGGKARIPSFEEVYDAVATSRYYVNVAPGLLRSQRRRVSFPGFTRTWEHLMPHGVVVNICPWNFPLTLAISDIVPALLAGNAVVVKPDEKTPYSSLYAASLLEEAGLPDGLLQVVTGYGERIGPSLIDNADFVVFTGSTEVGRKVAARAGERLIGASLELGGKNAAVVLGDANIGRTVPQLSRAVFANGGQLCIAAERIYVEETIREELTGGLVDHVRSLPITRRFDFSSALSSMITRDHLEKVEAHVEDAMAKGATLLTGGGRRTDVGPLFYEPTVLTGVDESMLVCGSETFGPVVSIHGFDHLDEAVVMVNDSEYGLNHSVWTADPPHGVEVARRLEAGTVGVNDGYAAAWSSYDAPMGGMKSSGLSRRHGAIGLLKFTESQTVASQRGIPSFAPPRGMGYPVYQRLLGPALKLLRRLPFYR